jgi:hypothetical protein
MTGTETQTAVETWSETDSITTSATITITCTPTYTSSQAPTNTFTSTATVTLTDTPEFSLTPTNTPVILPTFTPVITTQPAGKAAYPNPARGKVNIYIADPMGAQKVEISIYTAAFRQVKKATRDAVAGSVYETDVTGMATGLYVLRTRLLKDGREIYRNTQPVMLIK